jgi:hypothetical protein
MSTQADFVFRGRNPDVLTCIAVLDEVKHRLDHPRRSEHLPMVGDAFL